MTLPGVDPLKQLLTMTHPLPKPDPFKKILKFLEAGASLADILGTKEAQAERKKKIKKRIEELEEIFKTDFTFVLLILKPVELFLLIYFIVTFQREYKTLLREITRIERFFSRNAKKIKKAIKEFEKLINDLGGLAEITKNLTQLTGWNGTYKATMELLKAAKKIIK